MEPKLNPQPDLNTCNPLTDFKTMQTMATNQQNQMIYCDYIAALIKSMLGTQSGMALGKIVSDLHPEEGFLQSHKKVMQLDYMGRTYKITVEDV